MKREKLDPEIKAIYHKLREKILAIGDDIRVSESKYWIKFKSIRSRKAFAFLNPSKRQIRAFITIDPTYLDDPEGITKESCCSGAWKRSYPVQFKIREGQDLYYAFYLLKQAYDFSLSL